MAASLVASRPYAASSRAAHELAGSWSGTLACPDGSTPVYLRFDEAEDGTTSVRFDVPLTNIYAAPFGKLTEKDGGYELSPGFRFVLAGDVLTFTFPFGDRKFRAELKRGATPLPEAPHAATKIVQPAWTFATKGAVWSSPAERDGHVYFGSADGSVYAVRAKSGERAWSTPTGGAVMARPTIAGAHVFVPSDDGFLWKLDAASGAKLWTADLHGASVKRDLPHEGVSKYDYLASAATIEESTVYVGSADGKLYALDAATGAEKWKFETKGLVRSTPAIAGGLVVFGSNDGSVYAVNARGELAWKHATGDAVTSSPLVHDGRVYIGSRSADVFAFDAADGKVLWRSWYWFSWVESSAAVRDGVLYVGSSDYQRVCAIDADDGRVAWTFDTDGSAWSSPAVTDSSVFVGATGVVGYAAGHRGAFFAVERASGKERWRFAVEPASGDYTYGFASSPAVADGLVFVGGLDGKLYAFPER
ncbi:MAG: PQQ-binding-like beta-propeller repeat protein [Planctomycetota bacterium]